MSFDFDKLIKGIKKESKKLKKGLPQMINQFSDEIYEMKRLQKTLEKQARKISTASLISLTEQVLKRKGYTVAEQGKEVVATKGDSKTLVAVLAKYETWAERVKDAECTKGLVFTLEAPTKEDQEKWAKLDTEVLSIKDFMDWLVS